ncbi:jg7076, partial [Pararge aegeria aegeria]
GRTIEYEDPHPRESPRTPFARYSGPDFRWARSLGCKNINNWTPQYSRRGRRIVNTVMLL